MLTFRLNPFGHFLLTIIFAISASLMIAGCNSKIRSNNRAKSEPPPESVVITSPVSLSRINHDSEITISGTCKEGLTVNITGDWIDHVTCTLGAFTFTHTPVADGSFHYSVTQYKTVSAASEPVEISWTRDTLSPNEVAITAPAINPFFSGDNELTIAGICEIGSTVYLEDSPNQTYDCLLGTFSFTTSRFENNTYNFNLLQTDVAQNSSAVTLLQWVRDDSMPPTPTVLVPTANFIANHENSITISGGCVTGHTVTLTGDEEDSKICLDSAYSFTASKDQDGIYHYNIKQTSPAEIDSAVAVVTWERDSVAPLAPTLVTPAANPFASGDASITISGVCETGTTVHLTGDATDDTVCLNSEYSFPVSKNGNTTYTFSLTQTDRAGNVSGATSLTWVRDTNAPPTPVITTPALANYLSKTDSINIVGTCKTGNTVYLTGSSTQNMVCSNSTFQFLVNATNGDGSYTYTVKQKSATNGQFSGETSVTWTSDTTPPSVPVLTSVSPISPSSSLTPKLKGTAESGSIIKVYRSQFCTGSEIATGSASDFTGNGVTATITANDSYDFTVKAMDAAGNASACSSTYLTFVNRRAAMVTDLRTQGTDGSSPSSYFPFKGYLYFRAFTPNTGYELFRSDGTVAGTSLFKNFSIQGDGIPTSSSTVYAMNSPYAVGSVFYFAATDDNNGTELWKSDGTVAGTTLVKDINPGGGNSNPNGYVAVGSTLFFKADDGTNGEELWKTDGTQEGTVLVKDINPTGGLGAGITYLAALGSKLIFFADDGTNGLEPWVSDGTENGTHLISNINSSSASSSPNYLVVLGGYAFFSATGSSGGNELWKTDGTLAGTSMIDLRSGSSSSSPTYLTVIGNLLYFRATDSTNGAELWKSDGTLAGSSMIKNINTSSTSSSPYLFKDSGNGFIYFVATESTHGTELWRTDGTSDGTTLIKDINPGTLNTTFSTVYFNVYGGKLYFTATTNDLGSEPWVSDGTEAGTFNLKDIYPGASASSSGYFIEFQSKVYFTSSDITMGAEIYVTDGTTAGTTLFKDINTASSSNPSFLTSFGDKFLMSAITIDYGRELFISDGTAAGTTMIKDINPGGLSSSPSAFFVDGNKVYFSAFDDVNGTELWVTDGTTDGTQLLKNINPDASSSTPGSFIKLGSKIIFAATTDLEGRELWVTDGTTDGTTMIKDHFPGATGSSPSYLTVMGDYVYFYANNGTTGYELFRTDGTSAGTTLVKDIIAGSSNGSPVYLTVLGGNKILFRGTTSTTTGTGAELWISDGTTAGTTLLKDINPGGTSSSPTSLKLLNDKVIFSATTPAEGSELWVSDGTTGGTTLLKDIRPGAAGSSISQMVVIGNKLYFQANDGTNGTELWVTDGTSPGTQLVKNIAPGGASSGPYLFTDIGNGIVAFRAQDGVNGWELWRTDGTAANTYMVQDVNPFGGSYFGYILYYHNKVFFNPTDGVNGYELWSY